MTPEEAAKLRAFGGQLAETLGELIGIDVKFAFVWQMIERDRVAAVDLALAEAAAQVLGLPRGDWPIEFEDAWRTAQMRFAAAIKALKLPPANNSLAP